MELWSNDYWMLDVEGRAPSRPIVIRGHDRAWPSIKSARVDLYNVVAGFSLRIYVTESAC